MKPPLYGSVEVNLHDVDLDEQTVTTISSRRLPSVFGRKKQKRSSRVDDETTTVDLDERNFVADADSKGKLLDLKSLISLCVVRLKMPQQEEDNEPKNDIETGLFKGSVKVKAKFAKPFKSLFKGFKSAARSVFSVSLKPTSLLLPMGFPKDQSSTSEDHETNPEQTTRWSKCIAALFSPIQAVLMLLWGEMKTRVVMVPAVLLLLWIFVVSIESSIYQPLRALIDFVLPQLALVFSVMAIVGQCWICALPMASSLALLVSNLQMLIDAAFDEMTIIVPEKISKMLLMLKIPSVAVDNLCNLLFAPFASVLGTIFKIIPKVDNIIPPRGKDPKSLAPIVFIGLLVGLFFAQVLLLLTMGSMLNGTIAVILGAALCVALGWIALQASNIIPILLHVIEIILNTVVQSLIRKLLPISKLQKAIDAAQSLVPSPSKRKTKHEGQLINGRQVIL